MSQSTLQEWRQRLFSLSTTRALQWFQLLRQGAVLLTSILLAKSALSTEEIGAFEMLLYIGTVSSFFWVNGLLQAMAPVYGQMEEKDRRDFFYNNFLVFSALAVLAFLLLYGGRIWVVPALTGLPELPYFGLYCFYLLLHLPSFPVEYYYLLQRRARAIVWWGLASFGLQVLAIALPLWSGYGLEGSITALVGLGLLRWLWTVGVVLHGYRPAWRPDLIRRYLLFASPLIVNVLIGNFILLFDNWLVGWWYRDEAVFAVFRYGAREFPLAQALASALGVALIPRLTEQFQTGLQEMRDMSRRLFHLLFPLAILLVLVSGTLFPIVFNPDFAGSAPIFNIYLLMTASRVLLPNSIVLAKGEPRIILMVGLLELLVKIVAGFIFIHYWGLAGVAWSAVLAFWVEKAGLIWYLRRQHGLRVSDWLDLRWYLAYCGLLLAAYMGAGWLDG